LCPQELSISASASHVARSSSTARIRALPKMESSQPLSLDEEEMKEMNKKRGRISLARR
jgi:hypothetical protein